MPFYPFKCPYCEATFDKFLSMSATMPIGEPDSSIICEKCKKGGAVRQWPTGVSSGGMGEPWEYEETHRMKPKFVRDSQGNRHKFNPNVHRKGRKGSG